MLRKHESRPARVLVVWESVLDEDTDPPSAAVLGRIRDSRATQYWDAQRGLSKLLGEKDEETIVWDWIAVYPPGARWDNAPPEPAYSSRPVVKIIRKFEDAFAQAGASR